MYFFDEVKTLVENNLKKGDENNETSTLCDV